MLQEIKEIIRTNTQNKHFTVTEGRTFDGRPTIEVVIARNNVAINWVKGQFSECISFWIKECGKIEFISFWGCGGRKIYRKTDSSIQSEKYLALSGEIMPAIRIKEINRAVEKICKDYMTITKDIEKRNLTH